MRFIKYIVVITALMGAACNGSEADGSDDGDAPGRDAAETGGTGSTDTPSGAGTTGSGGSGAAGEPSSGGNPSVPARGGNGGVDSGGGGGSQNAPDGVLKGLAFATTKGECVDLDTLKVSWFYNWRLKNPCTSSKVPFVPMIWGSWKKNENWGKPADAVAAGYDTLLGFNEPDRPDQANLTVEEALDLWPDFDIPGLRIGSPAPANRDWLEEFMQGVSERGLRVDFVTFHWYGWTETHCNDTSRLESKIEWAEQWGKPIWITEWSCRNHPTDIVEKFYQDALEVFARHPLVERYSWYLSRSDGGFANARLVTDGGELTSVGADYAAASGGM